MLPVKKRVKFDGTIAMREVLTMAKIQPGDWVEIIPAENKIIIRTTNREKTKGAVRAAAGILKDYDGLVDEMLRIRDNENDRPSLSI